MFTDSFDVIDPILDNIRLSDLLFHIEKNKESVLKFLEKPLLSYTVDKDNDAVLSIRSGKVEQPD